MDFLNYFYYFYKKFNNSMTNFVIKKFLLDKKYTQDVKFMPYHKVNYKLIKKNSLILIFISNNRKIKVI